MSAPGAVRDEVLRDLRAAYAKLVTADARESLAEERDDTRREVGRLIGRLHLAIMELENTKLAEMADALEANEDDLRTASRSLREKAEALREFADVLETGARRSSPWHGCSRSSWASSAAPGRPRRFDSSCAPWPRGCS
jgi:glutamine synthetase type III